ncbi:plasmid recombination protein [Aliarcobacter cryaerophilus]|uniref:plasmid recombination protein n=1 Tax=Aliarcobacter cryaerophilus TaxID=28198 RepID=UPI0021B293AA|nr:plasmid recombination protein [Aliarcobacter cryaerophilus]MCT7484175.1 plasmid recombination protein [Aliarcobacter cryaerophilus]
MKNFINVRVQSYNYKKQYDLLRHNFRHKKDSLSQINEKPNFIISPDGKIVKLDNTIKKKIYDLLSKDYRNDRTKHNEIYKSKHKRNLRDFQSTWTEGILTFSEAIHKDLGNKYTPEDLIKAAISCTNDIAQKYGTKLNYLTLHMDETTPHFHFSLKNFDENGLSLWKKNQNKEFLSQLQDIAFEHFKALGMDRGVSKDITNKRYETIQKYHIRKEMELRDKVSNTQANYNKVQKEVEKSLKALYAEVNLQKNEVNDLRSNYDRKSQEYKDLTIVFKQLQVEEKTLREKVRELKEIDNLDNYLNDLKKDISKIIKSNVEKVDPVIGNSRIEVKNINKMYSELVSKISEPLNSKVKEVEEKDKAIKDLNDKLQNKEEVLEKVMTEKYEAIKENKVLKQDNLSKTNEITKLKQNHKLEINRLRNDLKRQIALRVKRINLINRLKNSNIAKKIIARLSKRNQNLDLNR